jgi:RNA polymerase sigma-70 factor, ECF subfamily
MHSCRAIHPAPTRTAGPVPEDHALVGVFAEVSHELTGRLFQILRDWEDARDAAQTAFLKCWRCRDRLGAVRDLRAWLFRVALNVAFDLRARGARRRAVPLDALADTLPGRQGATAEGEVLDRECLDLLRAALRELRPAEREVFLLRQESGLTYEEIAAARGQPVGTIKTQMRAALRKLRDRFEDHRTPRAALRRSCSRPLLAAESGT